MPAGASETLNQGVTKWRLLIARISFSILLNSRSKFTGEDEQSEKSICSDLHVVDFMDSRLRGNDGFLEFCKRFCIQSLRDRMHYR